jgi:hypothetical protein
MLKIFTSSSLYTGYYRAIKDYFQPLLRSFALALPVFAWMNDEKKIAVVVGVIYFIAYMLTSVASKNAGRFTNLFRNPFKPMNLTITGGLLAGVVSGVFFFSGWFVPAIIMFILILIIENLRKPIGVALIAEGSKREAYATVLSAGSQAKSLFSAIIAPFIGWISDIYSPGIGIAATSLILLLSFPLYWLNRNNTKR